MTTTKIAYKVAKNLPNLPDGFIIDHFDTIEDNIEGYQITSIENFNILFSQNGLRLHQYETIKNQKAIIDSQQTATVVVKNDSTKINKQKELFKEFLAWKAAQGNNS